MDLRQTKGFAKMHEQASWCENRIYTQSKAGAIIYCVGAIFGNHYCSIQHVVLILAPKQVLLLWHPHRVPYYVLLNSSPFGAKTAPALFCAVLCVGSSCFNHSAPYVHYNKHYYNIGTILDLRYGPRS